MREPRAYESVALPNGASAPWLDWLETPPGDLGSWLDNFAAQLTVRAAQLHDQQAQLDGVWSHMANALDRFRSEEIVDVVTGQLETARETGAVEALQACVHTMRAHRDAPAPPDVDNLADPAMIRRLLDSITLDRAGTGRALTGEVLETLCSIALDLELTERRVGHDPASIAQALSDLRGHITTAAHMVRALPDHVQVRAEAGEALAFAVRRCLVRYSGTLEAELTWSGGDASTTESSSALLWVLQELLHHLHQVVAGWAKVSVRVDSGGIAMRVETPSPALAAAGAAEPDWLLRSRLRLQLAGGEISTAASGTASYADVRLP